MGEQFKLQVICLLSCKKKKKNHDWVTFQFDQFECSCPSQFPCKTLSLL